MAGARDLNEGQYIKALNGSPSFIGVIVATTAKDNSNTAATFTIPAGSLLLLQSDTAFYVKAQTVAATAVTTANGLKIEAGALYVTNLTNYEQYVSCLAVSGTSNVKVFTLS